MPRTVQKRRSKTSCTPKSRYLPWLFACCLCYTPASAYAALDDALAGHLQTLQTRYNIPVLAVAVITPNRENQLRVDQQVWGATADTPLRWGSVTKTITALTMLSLAEAGKVDLQGPIKDYVDPQHWHNPWSETRPIRVIDLLEMRAGFTDLSALEFDFNEPVTLAEALSLNPAGRRAFWPPGLAHSYSNQTAGLSQLLIENISGVEFATAVAQHVFQPLKMSGAGFTPSGELPGGFEADGKTLIPYWHMIYPAFGALNASLEDLKRLLVALLTPTLSANSIAHLYHPHGRGDDFQFDYAAGFYPRVRQDALWHTHGGDADGYRSRIAHLNGTAKGYIVNINVDNIRALRAIERLLEAHLTKTEPKVAPVQITAPQGRSQWVGAYYPATVRFGLAGWRQGRANGVEIRWSEDGLIFHRGNRDIALLPVAEGQYRRKHDPTATVQFLKHKNEIYLQGVFGNFFLKPNCPAYLSSLRDCKTSIMRP